MPLHLLKRGLCFAASEALRSIEFPTQRIGQTVGNASASAGAHLADGTVHGLPYCAAVDLSVRDLSDKERRMWLGKLADVGFAGFMRIPGADGWPGDQILHLHAVFAGIPMKEMLRHQVHDWLHGLDGLAGHEPYTYWQPTDRQKARVRQLFLFHNPAEG